MNTEAVFKNIYENNFKRIYKFVYYRIPKKEDAEDIVAEVFSAVWANTANLKLETVTAFVYQIAKNKINDYLRKEYKLNFIHPESEFFDELAEPEAGSQKTEDGRTSFYENILSKFVEGLDNRDREFFKFKYKFNYSYTELAKEMNISVNNAKVINNRLLKKLKNLWTNQKK